MTKVKSTAKPNDLPPLRVGPREIRGRVTDEATIVRWVAENVDNGEVDPKTCPAPFAWTLLRQCRDVPGFLEGTFMPLWIKLVKPATQLENGPKELDGASVISLIERIQAHAAAAEGRPLPAPGEPKEVP